MNSQEMIKVLLFEKEEAFAEDVRRALDVFGYVAPTVTSSSSQFFDEVQSVKPDLILVGVSLAGWQDCIDAAEEVGTRFNIPLIYLSYQADADIFDRSLITNPYAFMVKPFNSIQLGYAIETALNRQRYDISAKGSSEFYRGVFEVNGSAMMLVDSNGSVAMVNRAFEEISGFPRDLILGLKNCRDFFDDDFLSTLGDLMESREGMQSTDKSALPVLFICDKRERKSVYLKVKSLAGTDQFVISMFDVAELKGSENGVHALNSELLKMNKELRIEIAERENYEKILLHQANHDSLTGLPNRQLLFDRLSQATAYVDRNKSMLALMLVDLDNFKIINDSLGHIAGDALLKEVAFRLQSCLRKYDTVARFGGDEFVLVANDMPDVHDIVRFAEKVLDMFQKPFDILGKPVSATASIGVAIYPIQSGSADRLLKMADTSMYQAKYEGGNAYRFFTESMNLKMDRRALMENRLREALEREEYLAHYQPRIDVVTRQIIGMEALMRWQPIDGPLAYPADFFSALEESGMIVSVGEWLLEKICRQNQEWHDSGLPPLRVAVNISERQFMQNDFSDTVSKALTNSGLNPRFLEIELPEHIVMKNVTESISRLKKLKSTGVTISVDNFGTGYSSLTHLNRLPIDDIQIDKSLINCIVSEGSGSDANVVSAIISMGHSLGKNLLAEGVESEEQFVFLAHRQCNEMQGHFFSRPLTSNEFEKLARRYTL